MTTYPVLDSLVRKEMCLYRGAGCSAEREIFERIGVGPIRVVARHVLEDPNMCGLSEVAIGWITNKLAHADPQNAISIPTLGVRLALEKVFEADVKPVLNHLVTNDHVLAESPLQTPSTYPDLQSASKRPATAIIYAYGIRPDHVNEPDHPQFYWREHPNTEAAVAVIVRTTDDSLARCAPIASAGAEEVTRRIQRDGEVLLVDLVRADVVVLPRFLPGSVVQSLEAAAQELRARGVAT